MSRITGSYSGYSYEYGQCNSSDKWVLKREKNYGNEEPIVELFDSCEACVERIQEIESWFDHRSPWD